MTLYLCPSWKSNFCVTCKTLKTIFLNAPFTCSLNIIIQYSNRSYTSIVRHPCVLFALKVCSVKPGTLLFPEVPGSNWTFLQYHKRLNYCHILSINSCRMWVDGINKKAKQLKEIYMCITGSKGFRGSYTVMSAICPVRERTFTFKQNVSLFCVKCIFLYCLYLKPLNGGLDITS